MYNYADTINLYKYLSSKFRSFEHNIHIQMNFLLYDATKKKEINVFYVKKRWFKKKIKKRNKKFYFHDILFWKSYNCVTNIYRNIKNNRNI